uniref:DNA primase n=1 Tax=Panagrellus redivivus TaxID=6233 RepID=A0A7E4WC83_PANRE
MADILNETRLKDYYKHFYPYKSVLKWLSYNNPEYLRNREFAFILENDVHLRYLNFGDASDQFHKELVKVAPQKIDLGAVYNHCPKTRHQHKDFKAVERELVFDIDLTDYDEIRNCCSGASVCQKCWRWMAIAVRCLDKLLEDHFGFQHRMWVFSGRRGIHCWVADAEARALDNQGRSAVAEYLSLIAGTKKVNLKTPTIHPMLVDAYEAVMTSEDITPLVLEQGWLDEEESWMKVLEGVEDRAFRDQLISQFHDLASADLRWKLLKRQFDETERKSLASSRSGNLPKPPPANSKYFLMAFILQNAYPRLDVNVSTGTNHLLKSPFCVHPKTGNVAVPLKANEVGNVKLDQLPTIGGLIDELSVLLSKDAADSTEKENDSPGRKLYYKHTSLAPYVETFDAFIDGAVRG